MYVDREKIYLDILTDVYMLRAFWHVVCLYYCHVYEGL
jgi:hypothetical protein